MNAIEKTAKPVVARTSARFEGDRAAFGAAWEALLDASAAMTRALDAEGGPVYLHGYADGAAARAAAGALLSAYFYEEDGPVNESIKGYGCLGAGPDLLAAVDAVNACREALATALAPFSAYRVAVADGRSEPALKIARQLLGLGGLHYRQAPRRIPRFDAVPERLSFSWIKRPSSVRRKGVAEVEALVARHPEAEDARAALATLAGLPDDEVLGVCYHEPPFVRMSADFGAGWQPPVRTNLPVVVPCTDPRLLDPARLRRLPDFAATAGRLPRRDRRLETVPLFAGPPVVYRYQAEWRT
jgi:hypothetical protein